MSRVNNKIKKITRIILKGELKIMQVRKIVSSIMSIIFVFTFAGTALAQNPSVDRVILLDKSGNKVIVPGPNVTDKSSYNPNPKDNPNPKGQVSPNGLGWPDYNPALLSSSYDKAITPPGGTQGHILTSFSSSVSYPTIETSATYSGHSSSSWDGEDPWNATSVKHTDKWWVSGTSVSVSYPSGVGITGSGSSANWTGTVNDNWQLYHEFSNITFYGSPIYRVYESSTGTFQFGNAFYTISCSDDALI